MAKNQFNRGGKPQAADFCFAVFGKDPSFIFWAVTSVAHWDKHHAIGSCSGARKFMPQDAYEQGGGYWIVGDGEDRSEAYVRDVAAELMAAGFQWRRDFQEFMDDNPATLTIRDEILQSRPETKPLPKP